MWLHTVQVAEKGSPCTDAHRLSCILVTVLQQLVSLGPEEKKNDSDAVAVLLNFPLIVCAHMFIAFVLWCFSGGSVSFRLSLYTCLSLCFGVSVVAQFPLDCLCSHVYLCALVFHWWFSFLQIVFVLWCFSGSSVSFRVSLYTCLSLCFAFGVLVVAK